MRIIDPLFFFFSFSFTALIEPTRTVLPPARPSQYHNYTCNYQFRNFHDNWTRANVEASSFVQLTKTLKKIYIELAFP